MRTLGLATAAAAVVGTALATAGAIAAQATPTVPAAASRPVTAEASQRNPFRPDRPRHERLRPERPHHGSLPRTTAPPRTGSSATPSPAAPTGAPVPTSGAPTSTEPTSEPTSTAPALPPSGRWDYQIGGAVEYSPAPAAVSRDNTDRPWPGVYSICYVNAFQSQPGDTSLKSSWLVVNGRNVEDPNWPGEYVLDTKGHRSQLVSAFSSVMSRCAATGFKAVEFDNLDSYDRSKGGLTKADNVLYAKELVAAAHRLGLAAAQKNAVELIGQVPFDFALAESCLVYSECGEYTAGYRVVLDVEYREEMSASTFQNRCASAVRSGAAPSFVFRDVDVSANGVRTWCTAQPAG